MEKFTISEYVDLPSKGLIYGEKKVAPEVHLSSMTTRHEMQRLSPSKSQFRVLCDILDDCIIGDLGIPSYDLFSGDYQFLMFKLRIATYGPEITLMDFCPHCGETSELKIDLDSLEVISDIDAFDKYRNLTLPKSGKDITLNYQTPRMLDIMNRKVESFKERTKGSQPDQTLAFLICEMIDTIDGKVYGDAEKEEWVRNLPMLDVQTISAYTTKMDEAIGVDTNLKVQCDACGRTHDSQLRIGPEFFRPEIDV